jgi:hypothetical protein
MHHDPSLCIEKIVPVNGANSPVTGIVDAFASGRGDFAIVCIIESRTAHSMTCHTYTFHTTI